MLMPSHTGDQKFVQKLDRNDFCTETRGECQVIYRSEKKENLSNLSQGNFLSNLHKLVKFEQIEFKVKRFD